MHQPLVTTYRNINSVSITVLLLNINKIPFYICYSSLGVACAAALRIFTDKAAVIFQDGKDIPAWAACLVTLGVKLPCLV